MSLLQVRSSIPVHRICAVERVDENAFQQPNMMQIITQDAETQGCHIMYIQCKVSTDSQGYTEYHLENIMQNPKAWKKGWSNFLQTLIYFLFKFRMLMSWISGFLPFVKLVWETKTCCQHITKGPIVIHIGHAACSLTAQVTDLGVVQYTCEHDSLHVV